MLPCVGSLRVREGGEAGVVGFVQRVAQHVGRPLDGAVAQVHRGDRRIVDEHDRHLAVGDPPRGAEAIHQLGQPPTPPEAVCSVQDLDPHGADLESPRRSGT